MSRFICTNPQQLPGGVISLRFVISFRWHWVFATDGTAAIPAKLPELGSRQFVVEPNLEWVEIRQREKGHQVLGLDLNQSKSGLVLRWSLRSSLAILIQVSIITFL